MIYVLTLTIGLIYVLSLAKFRRKSVSIFGHNKHVMLTWLCCAYLKKISGESNLKTILSSILITFNRRSSLNFNIYKKLAYKFESHYM